jgi:hypothetical protein
LQQRIKTRNKYAKRKNNCVKSKQHYKNNSVLQLLRSSELKFTIFTYKGPNKAQMSYRNWNPTDGSCPFDFEKESIKLLWVPPTSLRIVLLMTKDTIYCNECEQHFRGPDNYLTHIREEHENKKPKEEKQHAYKQKFNEHCNEVNPLKKSLFKLNKDALIRRIIVAFDIETVEDKDILVTGDVFPFILCFNVSYDYGLYGETDDSVHLLAAKACEARIQQFLLTNCDYHYTTYNNLPVIVDQNRHERIWTSSVIHCLFVTKSQIVDLCVDDQSSMYFKNFICDMFVRALLSVRDINFDPFMDGMGKYHICPISYNGATFDTLFVLSTLLHRNYHGTNLHVQNFHRKIYTVNLGIAPALMHAPRAHYKPPQKQKYANVTSIVFKDIMLYSVPMTMKKRLASCKLPVNMSKLDFNVKTLGSVFCEIKEEVNIRDMLSGKSEPTDGDWQFLINNGVLSSPTGVITVNPLRLAIAYCCWDVVCLDYIIKDTRRGMATIFENMKDQNIMQYDRDQVQFHHVDALVTSTLASLTELFFGLSTNELWYCPKNEASLLIQKTIIGGRVSLGLQGEVGPNEASDISGMYAATQQLCYFPVGPITQCSKSDIKLFNALLEENCMDIHKYPAIYGYFQINMPADTSNLPTMTPSPLNARVLTEQNTEHIALCELHGTYGKFILMNYITALHFQKYGYVVRCMEAEKNYSQAIIVNGPLKRRYYDYQSTLIKLKAIFEANGDTVARNNVKLLSNALYGKMAQRAEQTSTEFMTNNELRALLRKTKCKFQVVMPETKNITARVDDNTFDMQRKLVTITLPVREASVPQQDGSAILSYSKFMISDLYSRVDDQRFNKIPLAQRLNHVYYTDTDSLYVPLQDRNKTLLHDDRPTEWHHETMTFDPIQTKIESTNQGMIILGKKCYTYWNENKFTNKAKGQKLDCLHPDMFKRVLNDPYDMVSTTRDTFKRNIETGAIRIDTMVRKMTKTPVLYQKPIAAPPRDENDKTQVFAPIFSLSMARADLYYGDKKVSSICPIDRILQ